MLKGSIELATEVFGFPAREGIPGGGIKWPSVVKNALWGNAAGLILLGDAVAGSIKEQDGVGVFSEKTNFLKTFFKWLREFF